MRQMKQFVILLSAVLAFSSCVHKVQKEQQEKSIVHTNPLPVQFGDPYVLLASDGIYYMYGTGGGAVDGFSVYSSPDLANWKAEGQVFRGNVPGSWGVANFWAPEVYERGGKFYMLYSADWKENPTNELENFRIGVAVADKPTGPFKELFDKPLFDPGYPVIDGNLIDDEDGRTYLYFSRCCYKHPVESEIAEKAKKEGKFDEIEESWIYGIEVKPDLTEVIGEPVLLLRPPLKCTKQCHFIYIFQISAYRHTAGDPCHLDARRLDQFADIHRCCLTFKGGIGRNDHFRHISLKSCHQFLQTNIRRTDAKHRRDSPMQDMVDTFILLRLLISCLMSRSLNNHNDMMIPLRISTNRTQFTVCQIPTAAAVANLLSG